MTSAERVASLLGEHFAELDPASLARHRAFRRAVGAALDLVPVEVVVAQVIALGCLKGARNSHAVIVHRLRQLPDIASDRARLADELSEKRRWVAVSAAAHRGETLRALVDGGALFPDEAGELLRRELPDDDLLAIAQAALEGGDR